MLHFISKLNFVAHGVKFGVLELICTYALMFDFNFSMENELTLAVDLVNAGKQFLKSCNFNDCLEGIKQPVMLPPAPKQIFVDKFIKEDAKVKRKMEFDSKRVDYEAECDVYRALESLDERIIVLHGFKYTCKQWKDLGGHEENDKEWEQDFVVLIPDKAVICIEVKRPNEDKNYPRLYSEASKQCTRFGKFLDDMFPNLYYHKFCAFPHANKNDIAALKGAIPILWKEDIQNMSCSLNQCFGNYNEIQVASNIEALLIGLWLKNSSGFKTDTKACELVGYTINDINQRLKRQEIFLKPDKRSINIIPVPKKYKTIFADHLHGIKYITKEQRKLIELQEEHSNDFKEPYIFVNGPAGSGKTLMMYARILKLLECMSEEEHILMLLPWQDAGERFIEIVRKFNESITVKLVDLVDIIRKAKDDPDCAFIFSEKMKECSEKIVIFVRPHFNHRFFNISSISYSIMHECFLGKLKNKKWHIFCDDFHESFANTMFHYEQTHKSRTNLEPLADYFVKLLSTSVCDIDKKPRSLWISCDFMQTVQYSFWGTHEVYKERLNHLFELFDKYQEFSLSGNLRNHHGIAILLMDLVKKFHEISRASNNNLLKILPQQDFFHFIQGITTKLYCVFGGETISADDRMTRIIKNEFILMHESQKAANLKNAAFIPVYHHVSVLKKQMSGAKGAWCKEIENIVKRAAEGLNDFDLTLTFTDYVKYAVSIEFPCAVLIIDLSTSEDEGLSSGSFQHSLMNILAHLYVGISRARVYCSIILICFDDVPNELYKVIRDVLLPHVNTIEIP